MKTKSLSMLIAAAMLLAACKPIVLFTIGGEKDPYAGTELKTDSTGKVGKENGQQ